MKQRPYDFPAIWSIHPVVITAALGTPAYSIWFASLLSYQQDAGTIIFRSISSIIIFMFPYYPLNALYTAVVRSKRLHRTQCAKCGYDLAALMPDTRCPECEYDNTVFFRFAEHPRTLPTPWWLTIRMRVALATIAAMLFIWQLTAVTLEDTIWPVAGSILTALGLSCLVFIDALISWRRIDAYFDKQAKAGDNPAP